MKGRKGTGSSGSGTLIIIGGHEEQEGERVVLKEVASRVPDGKLVLVTVASSEPEAQLRKYQKSFGELGVVEVIGLHLDSREDAFSKEVLDVLQGVKAVFFSGGDQLRITSLLGGTPLWKHIMDIHDSGGVVAGTSAGASMMGEIMLVSGPGEASFHLDDVMLAPGLSLVPGVTIDQHFAERGRIGRLVGAVSMNPRILGLGIDEDTAIVVQSGTFETAGSGAVYIIDGIGISYCDVAETRQEETISIHDARLHVLSAGSRFDLAERRPVRGQHNDGP